ncbi:MAG TPA: hypothetical protein VGN97_18910 [Mesorhizobium sp.]|jgi:hypothetical protein|nr:hypothetical protein [Mesorhizobium sp.]
MRNAGDAHKLRLQIGSLETMTRFVLATLALGSGVYTYLGVRSLLDGSAAIVFAAAVIYAASVSVAMYGFWTYLIRFVPLMRETGALLALIAMMLLGSGMIVAMSSWLNAAALAGSAAVEQHLAITLEDLTADLDQAHGNALAALSLLPDIQRAGERFSRLAEDERSSGALTGTTGSGSVVQLLTQMAAQMKELKATVAASRETIDARFAEGQTHLATMRSLVSAPGPIAERSDQFASASVALGGVVAALERTSIAPSVSRAASDLSLGFIAPVADGRDADLVGRQDQVMGTIRASVAAQSQALADAANEILAQPRVEERRYVPLTSAEAVLRYAGDFIPSWAGAISIDLLPAVLVGIMAVVHGAIRRSEESLSDADRMTAAELFRAVELQEQFRARLRENERADIVAAVNAEAAAEPGPAVSARAENVTPLTLGERKPRTEP